MWPIYMQEALQTIDRIKTLCRFLTKQDFCIRLILIPNKLTLFSHVMSVPPIRKYLIFSLDFSLHTMILLEIYLLLLLPIKYRHLPAYTVLAFIKLSQNREMRLRLSASKTAQKPLEAYVYVYVISLAS